MTYLPSPARYDTMTYRRCGRSGLMLPAISLGLWHNFGDITPFGVQRDILRTAFDYAQAARHADAHPSAALQHARPVD